uniref:Non-reducing end beta-L-arabinofuranosidase-like GH127 catalytic domain-containing protein n=1 Tax=Populus alba TaxID=43335 RepID=A0A4U5Q1B2_POPAL|nr:hypothetical protein D5086_0000149460 [Populus alba]
MPGCRYAGRMVPYLGLKEKMLEEGQNFVGRESDPKRLASTLQTENEESCTTYNMLKVSRHLFRWTKEMAYADYYERALTNGVLGIQRGTEPGVMIYMLPQHPGSSKAKAIMDGGHCTILFGAAMEQIIPPFLCFCAHNLILFFVSDSKGIESFSKLGDSIYFEEEGEVPGLYIIQYISSSLDWKSGQIMINQKVDPVVSSDPYLRVTFTFSPNEVFATIDLSQKHTEICARVKPSIYLEFEDTSLDTFRWCYRNNKLSEFGYTGSSFLSVNRKWSSGDKLSLQLPISLRTEAIQDDRHQYASIQAILYGPYLLAGHTSGAWNLAGSVDSLSDSITPIPASYNEQLVSFSQDSGNSTFVLTNSNQSITMEENPKSGTDACLQATFKIVFNDSTSSKVLGINDVIDKSVMLECFSAARKRQQPCRHKFCCR